MNKAHAIFWALKMIVFNSLALFSNFLLSVLQLQNLVLSYYLLLDQNFRFWELDTSTGDSLHGYEIMLLYLLKINISPSHSCRVPEIQQQR